MLLIYSFLRFLQSLAQKNKTLDLLLLHYCGHRPGKTWNLCGFVSSPLDSELYKAKLLSPLVLCVLLL